MSLERLRTGFDRDVYYFLYDEDVDAITARLTIQKLENWILGKCQIDLTQNKRVFDGISAVQVLYIHILFLKFI